MAILSLQPRKLRSYPTTSKPDASARDQPLKISLPTRRVVIIYAVLGSIFGFEKAKKHSAKTEAVDASQ
jgi:hypothetical protein